MPVARPALITKKHLSRYETPRSAAASPATWMRTTQGRRPSFVVAQSTTKPSQCRPTAQRHQRPSGEKDLQGFGRSRTLKGILRALTPLIDLLTPLIDPFNPHPFNPHPFNPRMEHIRKMNRGFRMLIIGCAGLFGGLFLYALSGNINIGWL